MFDIHCETIITLRLMNILIVLHSFHCVCVCVGGQWRDSVDIWGQREMGYFPKCNLGLSKWIISQAARRSRKPWRPVLLTIQAAVLTAPNWNQAQPWSLWGLSLLHCVLQASGRIPRGRGCCFAVSLQTHERGRWVFGHSPLFTCLSGKWFDISWPGEWEGVVSE